MSLLKKFFLFRKNNDLIFIMKLEVELRKLGLNLFSLPVDAQASNDKRSNVLVIILGSISGVLGLLLIAVLFWFFVQSQSYKRQIKVQNDSNFGPDSPEMNKNIRTLPNTNKFANERSNPVMNNSKKPKTDQDTQSIISSDSDDFAGLQDNPIFNISRKVDDDKFSSTFI